MIQVNLLALLMPTGKWQGTVVPVK